MKKITTTSLFSILSSFYLVGQPMDWLSLTQTLDWNVNTMNVYNGSLIAAGDFSIAGGIQAHRIAAWNGSFWSPLGSGINANGPSIQKTLVYNNELYVAGRFDSAGLIATKNFAKWNGSTWSGFGTLCDNVINTIAVYNNEIYAGGTFTNIGGITSTCIAKWNGSNWQSLGLGIHGSNVNDLYVYQNELYALGGFDNAGGTPCNNIARWNGSNWSNVSIGATGAAMIEWQGNLLVGTELKLDMNYSPPKITNVIKKWDGVTWSVFSDQDMLDVKKFIIFNNQLYCSGGLGTGPAGYSYVMKWNQSNLTWTTIGSGVNNNIPALCEYNSELYCGGRFNVSTGAYHNYIAKWGISTGIENISKNNLKISLYPNPISNKLNIESEGESLEKITIINFLGEILYTIEKPFSKQEIDVTFLQSGICFLVATSDSQKKVFKIIKE